ncbi:MAG: hypothetical protein RJA76_1066 [Bacteroidota bacterium]|jgi:hypothetical protein
MLKRIIQNNWIIFFSIIFISLKGYSQKEVHASGEYSFKIEKDQTFNQAKELVIEQAKINAIEKAFGRVIINGNTSYVQNDASKGKSESNSKFNFFSDSFVKGEWLRDTSKPNISIQTVGEDQWIFAKVQGIVREITTQAVGFKLFTCNCLSINCNTNIFNNNQEFYVGFQSPVSGYLALYLEDLSIGETSKILPYELSEKNVGSVKIEKNKFYWFFSKKNDSLDESNKVDEMTFKIAENNLAEYYKLYILFSEIPFISPIFSNDNEDRLNEKIKKSGYTLPKSLDNTSFLSWLQKFRGTNKKVQFDIRYLSLKK